jgi:hypothetical protein
VWHHGSCRTWKLALCFWNNVIKWLIKSLLIGWESLMLGYDTNQCLLLCLGYHKESWILTMRI